MADKIQIRRGLKADLPVLDEGELGFCTDTNELFVGSTDGNVLLTKEGTAADGFIVVESPDVLRNKYPDGLQQPIWVISEKSWYYWDDESNGSDEPPPAAPTASPIGGEYNEPQSITLTAKEADTIFYTLDGTEPTPETGLIYSRPIEIHASTILKFIAQDISGNISRVYTEIYTISIALNLRVTDGLVSAYHLKAHTTGTEIADSIGDNSLNMIHFKNPSLSIVSEGIKGDMDGHIVSSSFSNITGSFTFVASLRFERENRGYGNLFSLFGKEFNLYHEAPGNNRLQIQFEGALRTLTFEEGTVCTLYRFEPEVIFVKYDHSVGKIAVYFNDHFVFEEKFTPSAIPAIKLFDGYTANSSVKGQGESVFNAVLMYDRTLSEQEMNTVTNDIKLLRFKNPDKSNDVTTVTEELIAAYDLTAASYPSDGDYHRSLVGESHLTISPSPETSFYTDGSLKSSTVIPSPRRVKMGYNTTVAFIGRIEDSGVPFIIVAAGQKWRYRSEQIWLAVGDKSVSAENRVSFPNDEESHTMIVTTEKNGSDVETNIYVDGVLYGTQTFTFDSAIRPYENGDNLSLDRSKTPKRAMLLYDKTLSPPEITQLHHDLKTNIG